MKPEDRDLIVQLCAARSGQQLDPSKDYVIENRLGPVARREGFDSVPDLIQALRTRREDALIWAIVEAMAAGDTSFFRDRLPFEALRTEIAPELVRRRAGQPIRIWSAACATGQEVHSIAMVIDEIGGQFPEARFELFGSDLSERALEKAQSGLYTQFEVQRGLPILIYFDQPTKERLVERFARQLAPGGFLYIGHSERATGPAASLLEAVGPTIYRRIAA